MSGTILGIGPMEVLFILILILLVFGPERLPEFTRGLGTALRRLRETYIAFTQEFKGELQPIAQDIDEVTRELRKEVQAIREAADLRSIIQPYANDISKAVQLESPANGSSNAATPTLPPASSAPAALPQVNGASPVAVSAAAPVPSVNGVHAPASRSSAAQSSQSSIELPADNPWAALGATIRSDKLDDDSPWRM